MGGNGNGCMNGDYLSGELRSVGWGWKVVGMEVGNGGGMCEGCYV